jgi:hypothetical protein
MIRTYYNIILTTSSPIATNGASVTATTRLSLLGGAVKNHVRELCRRTYDVGSNGFECAILG